MKLSDAIRLGSSLRRQTRNRYFDEGGSCALGAAAEASGVPYNEELGLTELRIKEHLREAFPILATFELRPCPVCGYRYHLISHLNDKHEWTREQIANYVALEEARIEQKQESTREEAAALLL